MFTALTFFDCMMARVQVPMAAVEFVVGYHDLVLSLVGWSPYITELVYPELVCEQHSASQSLLPCHRVAGVDFARLLSSVATSTTQVKLATPQNRCFVGKQCTFLRINIFIENYAIFFQKTEYQYDFRLSTFSLNFIYSCSMI